MAESQEELEEYTHQRVVREHHTVWSHSTGEHLTLQHEDDDSHDKYMVCLELEFNAERLQI